VVNPPRNPMMTSNRHCEGSSGCAPKYAMEITTQ
jgi:hypothetical protein